LICCKTRTQREILSDFRGLCRRFDAGASAPRTVARRKGRPCRWCFCTSGTYPG
jgi:hypothetical protein